METRIDLFKWLLLRRMKTLRVSVSIYNPTRGTTTAKQISAGGSAQGRLPDPSASGTRCYPSRGARLHLIDLMGDDKTQEPLRTHSTTKMTLQFERKYSSQGSGAPCHVSFDFFSEFYGISLAELPIDPQLESTIRPKAQGLHSIWNAILQIAFSIWFLLQRQHEYY
jgi:hypothetical protein